ncbi:GNAT family N-acetyltransferase [Paenibacillus sp. D2_2]|uniref:GNAT family N-acetyltransferase n=1 Tax=Paenibacillus sp. D2_2 TaxID=3073092 RepID=UPI002815B02B|nr:GNAT family N-acetyltransferase [Paenibacillus sp. D2_2]WMT39571.1 GNAT family N-acetyltransferase [Paenibacillus sp. D2_2]
MNWLTLKPNNEMDWKRKQSDILAFICRYGGKRMYRNVYQELLKLSYRDLSKSGTSLQLVTVQAEDGPRIAAFSGATGYGQDICIVVVHPLYRRIGLGTALLKQQLAALGSLTCRIALDDLGALQMGFRAGLCARGMIKIHGGKRGLLLQDPLQDPLLGPSESTGKQESAANLAQRR